MVARLLTDRGELESNRGRSTLAVLLTQDGALVPVLILIGLLGGGGDDGSTAGDVGDQIASAAIDLLVMTATISVVGIFILPRVFDSMILRRNRDFAIVTAIITCLSAAWGSHAFGLSPALGAFVAGVLLARVSISRQIRADTGALRALFLTLFFASVGMLANVRELIQPEILKSMLAILGVGLVLKTMIAWFAIRITGSHRRVAPPPGCFPKRSARSARRRRPSRKLLLLPPLLQPPLLPPLPPPPPLSHLRRRSRRPAAATRAAAAC